MATTTEKLDEKLKAVKRKLRAAKWSEFDANGTVAFNSPDTSATIWLRNFRYIESEYFPKQLAETIYPDSKAVWGLQTFENALAFTTDEKGRYALNDFYLEWAGNAQRLVATDGRRLCSIVGGASETNMTQAEPKNPETTNVHAKSVVKLYDVMSKLGGGDWSVQFAVGYINKVNDLRPALFMFGVDCVAVVHAGEGLFPDYRAVLPKSKHKAKLNDCFFNAFEVVGQTTCDRAQYVRIELHRAGSESVISLRAKHLDTVFDVDTTTTLNPMPATDDFKSCALGLKPEYIDDAGRLVNGMRGQGSALELHYTDNNEGVYIVNPQRKLDQVLIMPVGMTPPKKR